MHYLNNLFALLSVITFFGCGSDEPLHSQDQKITWSEPGGNATIVYDPNEPFMQISSNISEDEIASVSQGRELFIAHWFPAPNSRTTLDGLGPLFNANACSTCHIADGRIDPYKENGELDPSFLFRIGDIDGNEHPVYGGQLQTQSTIGVAEGSVSWSLSELNSSKILFNFISDESLEDYHMGPRLAPHLLGMGLLDLISEKSILEYADPNDQDNDGISGRAHWVYEEGLWRIGRFGWKAINATLRTQNAGAMHQDMGLTSSVNLSENCTNAQEICDSEANGGTPEVSESSLMAIVNFMSALGVPQRRISDQSLFDKGADIFDTIGCASCHRATFETSKSEKFATLSQQRIYPYTDLLLHDMGESLSDGIKEKDAAANEWRTPPLWGIGIVEAKEGSRFLHDGRAQTIAEAIGYHAGEATKVRENFMQLTPQEKTALLEFLRAI